MRWLHGEPARDDRGRVVETLSVRAIRSANVGKAPAALAKQLRDIVKNRAAGFDPMNLVISLVLVLSFLAALYLLPIRGLPYYGAIGAFVVFQVWVLRWCAERRMAREVAGTIAAHGLCGSCGYTLQDLPPDPDGCVVCPECGSAWDAERMTRAHWRPEKATLFAPRTFASWALLALPGLGTDARAVLHRRLDTRLACLPTPARDARPAKEWAALRRDLRRIGRGWRIALSVPVFVLLACCVRWLLLEILDPNTDVALAIFLAVTIPFLAYVATAVLCSEWGVRRRPIEDAFVRHGACPVCAAGLERRETRRGALMCCDSCGCAWKPAAPASRAVRMTPAAVPAEEPHAKNG